MKEISVIINGTRYDAIDIDKSKDEDVCMQCEMNELECEMFYCCPLGFQQVFKVSEKIFEP